MPNADVHRLVGRCAGAATAAYCARGQNEFVMLFETFGGVIGGDAGARCPDLIDLPTSPNHRSYAHGVAPVGAGIMLACQQVPQLQAQLRALARRQAQFGDAAESSAAQAWYLAMETLCYMLTGAVAGFPAGYASHLALDATTRKGLPPLG